MQSSPSNAPGLRVRLPVIGVAVVLGLLVGGVAGLVVLWSAVASKSRTRLPVAVSTAAKQEIRDWPMVRKIDAQTVAGAMQVTISVDQLTGYDAHRLAHPDRIYLDLHDVRLAPDLEGKTLFINHDGLNDIRLADTQPDTVRVVLDLEKRRDYTLLEQTNPQSLIVRLRPRGKQPAPK